MAVPLPLALVKLWAFVKRDFRIESSYKLAFILQILTSIFPVLSFFFVAKLVDSGANPQLDRYGGDYFPFVVVGVALSQYFMAALRVFADTVRRAQMAGVLEAMLSTQTSPQGVILYTAAYSFIVSTLHMLVVFGVAGLALGVDYGNANLLAVCVALVLTIAAFSGLGILSATGIVVLKKGDPVEILIGSTSALLGGAFFPIAVMPDWMQWLAKLLPITHALEAMRLAIFGGYSVAQLAWPLGVLGAMAALLLPASLWVFSRAVEKGRRDGTLVHY